jgi:hypothetical protein
MANYGIKIAKPGKSITSTDPKDYIFWSKYQTLSLYQKTTTSITLPAGNQSATVTVTHNLGYRPHVWVFASDCGGRYSKLPYRNYLCTDCDLKYEIPYLNFTYKITTTQVILILNGWCENASTHSKRGFYSNVTFNPVDVFIFREQI